MSSYDIDSTLILRGRSAELIRNCVGSILAERYRLGAALADGFASAVFEGTDLRTGRAIAAKLLLPTKTPASARLLNELRSARIDHPNICAVLDTGVQASVPFVILERLRGETLGESIIQSAPLRIDVVVAVFVQLLSALAAVHDANVVHRDVKPSNVFLAVREGCTPLVKLLDFDISVSHPFTGDPVVAGTPAYIAPEQAAGIPDPRSDIHAAGVSLFEALAGRRPYSLEKLAQEGPLRLHEGAVPDVRTIRADVPDALAAIVARAMARSPYDRFETARAMLAALIELHLGHEPTDDGPRSTHARRTDSGLRPTAMTGREDTATTIARPGGTLEERLEAASLEPTRLDVRPRIAETPRS